MSEAKTAVITGAGSGVGRASAIALAEAGFRIAALGRRREALEETLAACRGGDAGLAVAVDVTDEQAVIGSFAQVAGRFGRIDVVFNNAGSFGAGAPVDEVDAAGWRAVIDVNLTGAFFCAREAFRQMKRQSPQGGRIINNGSVSAQVPRPHAIAYTASKHAVTGLTKSLSLEGRRWNIACGQIDIGNAQTPMAAGISGGALQAGGDVVIEPMMDVQSAADAVVLMARMPPEANVQFLTVMATAMPFIGRG